MNSQIWQGKGGDYLFQKEPNFVTIPRSSLSFFAPAVTWQINLGNINSIRCLSKRIFNRFTNQFRSSNQRVGEPGSSSHVKHKSFVSILIMSNRFFSQFMLTTCFVNVFTDKLKLESIYYNHKYTAIPYQYCKSSESLIREEEWDWERICIFLEWAAKRLFTKIWIRFQHGILNTSSVTENQRQIRINSVIHWKTVQPRNRIRYGRERRCYLPFFGVLSVWCWSLT